MVREGYAGVMTMPPNVKHEKLFLRLQEKAKKKLKGFWGLGVPIDL